MNLRNKYYEVVISEDVTYTLFSVDNKPYDLVVEMDTYTRSSHYITLAIQATDLNSGDTASIAVVGGIYSFTAEHCVVLDETKVIVLMQDTIVES